MKDGSCDESLLYANIRTFDSFASQLLLNVNPEVELKGSDYDDRIRLAIDCLKTEKDGRILVSKYKHVLIDEIQDLVGIRAEFVQRILENLLEGISLFGDPAQAIYDYLMQDKSEGPTSYEFLNWLKNSIANLSVRDNLTINHRVGSNTILEQMALDGRNLISGGKPLLAFKQLHKTFSAFECCGRLNDPRLPMDSIDSNTAVLCRTNGQVLCLARKLFELAIRFNIRQRFEERTIPAWVARVFCGRDGAAFGKTEFAVLYERQCNSTLLSSHEAWLLLKDIEGGKTKSSIDIMKLRHALLYEKAPAESTGTEPIVKALYSQRSIGQKAESMTPLSP